MKTFHCSNCGNLVFFENTKCLKCGHTLAYLPDRLTMAALSPTELENEWHVDGVREQRRYRLCANYSEQNICNWAVAGDESEALCRSCRLTSVTPDQTPAGMAAWERLEGAKRRLLHGLLELQLPLANTDGRPSLTFRFVQDADRGNSDQQRALTGHDNGVITINTLEADDVQRERQRQLNNEPYRTLLGHFRHETGHYFWDQLIKTDEKRLHAFRKLFGDERDDYAQALRRHYEHGPVSDWQESFISAYASAHPWEDWAETWAHFLHLSDALETAGASGLTLRPSHDRDPRLTHQATAALPESFDSMMRRWGPLSYVLNNLSRGLGLADSYPFVLSERATKKLRFVYDTVAAAGNQKTRSVARGSRVTRVASSTLIALAAAVTVGGLVHALLSRTSSKKWTRLRW